MSFGKTIKTDKITQNEIDEWRKIHVDPKIKSYYIEETKGAWQGEIEDSFNLVVVTDAPDEVENVLQEIGISYKIKFNQDAVIFTKECMIMFSKL